jgi:hypothetical protein
MQVRIYSKKGNKMRRPALTPSRVLWLACACLCLLPHLAAAGQSRTLAGRQWLTSESAQLVRSHGLHRIDDGDFDSDVAPALARIPQHHFPPVEASGMCAVYSALRCHPSPAVQPFSPRPPPERSHR